jgi:hypothetical protein
MGTATETRTEDGEYGLQVTTALVVGGILTLVGVVGYVLQPDEGLLFGVFGVNALHNAVHVVTGFGGLAAGYAAGWANEYNKYGGLAYLLVFALGVVAFGFMEDPLNVNTADNLLHLGLAVVLAGVGFGVSDRWA